MNAKQAITRLQHEYPGKEIVVQPNRYNPQTIICEVEPASEFPRRSVAIAAIKSVEPHKHERSDEVYEVLEGELLLSVGNALWKLRKGDKHKVHRGEVHAATVWGDRDFSLVRIITRPGWRPDDHIQVSEE